MRKCESAKMGQRERGGFLPRKARKRPFGRHRSGWGKRPSGFFNRKYAPSERATDLRIVWGTFRALPCIPWLKAPSQLPHPLQQTDSCCPRSINPSQPVIASPSPAIDAAPPTTPSSSFSVSSSAGLLGSLFMLLSLMVIIPNFLLRIRTNPNALNQERFPCTWVSKSPESPLPRTTSIR